MISLSCALRADFSPKFDDFVTKKGIPLLLYQRHDVPTVSISMAFKGAGYAYEKVLGISDVVKIILENGWTLSDTVSFYKDRDYSSIGINFSVDQDNIVVNLYAPRDSIDMAFQYFIDIVKSQDITDEFFEKAVSTYRQNKKIRSSHAILGMEKLRSVSFFGHPYSGNLEENTEITKDMVLNFISDNFTRINIKAAASGDIGINELSELCDKNLSQLSAFYVKSYELDRVDPKFSNEILKKQISTDREMVIFAHEVPAYGSDDYYKSLIFSDILYGNTLSSILGNRLREEMGLTYGVSGQRILFENSQFGAGFLYTSDVDLTIQTIKDIINEIKIHGIEEDLFNTFKKNKMSRFTYSLTSNRSVSSFLLDSRCLYNDSMYLTNYLNKLNSVSYRELDDFARNSINIDKLQFVVVGS